MPYREKLMADAHKWGAGLFASRIRLLEREYEKAERRAEVVETFAKLFRQWNGSIEAEAASVGICYLYSSILMQTGELRLTLYGKEFYLDNHQLELAWIPSCFFQMYEQDMAEIIDKLQKEHPRIYQYEKDAVRYQYAEYYYAAIAALCRDMLDEIKSSKEYKLLNKTDNFFFFFGRWRGEAERLESVGKAVERHGEEICIQNI